jgi:hypothetical protein
MTTAGKNRIMISPKSDGTYVIEFTTAAAESLAISIPGTEAAVIRHFQERMPYGLFVPEMDAARDFAQTALPAALVHRRLCWHGLTHRARRGP